MVLLYEKGEGVEGAVVRWCWLGGLDCCALRLCFEEHVLAEECAARGEPMKKKTGTKGLVSLEDVLAALPEEERKRIEARGAELVAKIRRRMTLAEMRKGQKMTQAALAEKLGIGQMQISRLEKRKDPRLSTIQRTVAAMGGTLTMVVKLPGQEPLVLEAK